MAVKYLLRRCEACLTASEASSYDEVKFLPSANDEGLRRIYNASVGFADISHGRRKPLP